MVDFCFAGVGAITAHFLADFGAEVIKVESRTRYDDMRLLAPFKDDIRDADGAIWFARYNQNKLGILINLKKPKGIELVKKLVAISDVALENYSISVMPRLGLSYEDLCRVKPDIIMCSMSFAGQSGPYKDFRGMGPVLQGMVGLNELTGWPDRSPAAPGTAYTDHYLPQVWATAVLAALDYRRRTGQGMYIDASDFEAGVEVVGPALLDYTVNGRIQRRRGNAHAYAAPHGVYRCRGEDRWCAISVFDDTEWQSLCQAMDNPPMAKDDRFSTQLGRFKHSQELDSLVQEWTSAYSAEEVTQRLQKVGVAASIVATCQDLHEDPQLGFREHFWYPTEPELEGFTFEAPAARLSKTPAQYQRPRPRMGEHNDHIFTELLGLSDEEYAQLIGEGVIA